MTDFSKDEALAFIESMRLAVDGKVGFKWLGERMSRLTRYVEAVADENERLNAYLDASGTREDYEAYLRDHATGTEGGS